MLAAPVRLQEPEAGGWKPLLLSEVRFLLHPEPGPRVAEALRELGHSAAGLADLGLPESPNAEQVLEACRSRQYELLTGSREFLDAVLPGSGRGEVFGRVIVYLQDRPEEHELAVHRLFERYRRLTPGRLYTVTGGRVKVRQLPSGLESRPRQPRGEAKSPRPTSDGVQG